MAPYVEAAQKHFGNELLLLAHYYMGGEIVKLVEQFGGYVGDSYQLSLMAVQHPEKSVIVESAVHFMAESVSLLAHPLNMSILQILKPVVRWKCLLKILW